MERSKRLELPISDMLLIFELERPWVPFIIFVRLHSPKMVRNQILFLKQSKTNVKMKYFNLLPKLSTLSNCHFQLWCTLYRYVLPALSVQFACQIETFRKATIFSKTLVLLAGWNCFLKAKICVTQLKANQKTPWHLKARTRIEFHASQRTQ